MLIVIASGVVEFARIVPFPVIFCEPVKVIEEGLPPLAVIKVPAVEIRLPPPLMVRLVFVMLGFQWMQRLAPFRNW